MTRAGLCAFMATLPLGAICGELRGSVEAAAQSNFATYLELRAAIT